MRWAPNWFCWCLVPEHAGMLRKCLCTLTMLQRPCLLWVADSFIVRVGTLVEGNLIILPTNSQASQNKNKAKYLAAYRQGYIGPTQPFPIWRDVHPITCWKPRGLSSYLWWYNAGCSCMAGFAMLGSLEVKVEEIRQLGFWNLLLFKGFYL